VASVDRAVSEETLGAWLVKANPRVSEVAELARSGFAGVTSRCVRPSYRTELVRPGQPVLLWVSGGDREHPAGLYAAGQTTGAVTHAPGEPAMPVRLRPVDPPVLKEQLLALPGAAHLEVVRMPAGSNPSYVGAELYRTLLQHFPQLAAG
jgi:hypothetical protein